MGALDIRQAESTTPRDCITCSAKNNPDAALVCAQCYAPERPYWSRKPTPLPVTTCYAGDLPYDIEPTPAAVRHIYICAKYGIPLKAQFVTAEQMGNAPIFPLRWIYQTFPFDSNNDDHAGISHAELDQIEKLATELWVMGDALDDDMLAEFAEAVRIGLPWRRISDADIAAWDKRRREG